MVPVDIFMFHDKIWHIPETHLLHIFMGKPGIQPFAQSVVGVWIQGYVHHSLFGLGRLRHPQFEILESTSDVDVAGTVVEDFVCIEDTALLLVYLFAVVRKCAV